MLMTSNTWICIMKGCRPNDSVHGMYEHVGEILKHKHNSELDKKETYLSLFKLTQLKDI